MSGTTTGTLERFTLPKENKKSKTERVIQVWLEKELHQKFKEYVTEKDSDFSKTLRNLIRDIVKEDETTTNG